MPFLNCSLNYFQKKEIRGFRFIRLGHALPLSNAQLHLGTCAATYARYIQEYVPPFTLRSGTCAAIYAYYVWELASQLATYACYV